MKTSHIVIAVSLVAAAGGGAYLYWNSASRKKKAILKMASDDNERRSLEEKFNRMTDYEIGISYKAANNLPLNNIEKTDLEVISRKYNIFT